MDLEKVSVLIPTYNSQKYIKRCLDSVLNQSYKNIEIVIVDDGSKDNTVEIINEYISKYDNIKLICKEKNEGLFLSRKTAIENCSGDVIAFLDSDDFIEQNYYEVVVSNLKSNNSDICIVDAYEFEHQETKKIYNSNLYNANINVVGKKCFELFFETKAKDRTYQYLWNKIITKDLLQRSMKDIVKVSKNIKTVTMGEDILYSTIFTMNAKKITNTHDTKHYYFKHEEQSINVNNKGKFFLQANSVLSTFNGLKKYLKSKLKYNKYKETYNMWLKNYLEMFYTFSRINYCKEEYLMLIKKYKIKFTHEVKNRESN